MQGELGGVGRTRGRRQGGAVVKENAIEKFRRTFGAHPVAAADLRRENPELARRMAEFLDAHKDDIVKDLTRRVRASEER